MSGRLLDAAFGAGWAAVQAVPRPVADLVGRAAADAMVRRGGKGARRLAVNLRRVIGPDPTEAELTELTRQAMRSYARYWVETFRLPVMDRAVLWATIDRTTEGAEHLDKAYAEGRGVILALPHSGNYEAAGVWLIERGMPFTTVVERLRPESLYERFVDYRERLGMEIVPLTGGDRSPNEVLTERLRAGGIVCLLSDRDIVASGVRVDFFGETATMPAGPAYLAIRTGAVLLPVGLWYLPGGWGQRVHPAVEVPTDGTLPERIGAMTQALADRFAADIAEHPADWHMLQRLWLADLPTGRRRS